MSTAAPSLRHLTPPASLLLLGAAGAWVGVVVVARRMGPMPGTMGLGLGTFIAIWALMMAAMMLPSVTLFASLYTRSFTEHRGRRLAALASMVLERTRDSSSSRSPRRSLRGGSRIPQLNHISVIIARMH